MLWLHSRLGHYGGSGLGARTVCRLRLRQSPVCIRDRASRLASVCCRLQAAPGVMIVHGWRTRCAMRAMIGVVLFRFHLSYRDSHANLCGVHALY